MLPVGTRAGRRISQNGLKSWRCTFQSHRLSSDGQEPGLETEGEYQCDDDRRPSEHLTRQKRPACLGVLLRCRVFSNRPRR